MKPGCVSRESDDMAGVWAERKVDKGLGAGMVSVPGVLPATPAQVPKKGLRMGLDRTRAVGGALRAPPRCCSELGSGVWARLGDMGTNTGSQHVRPSMPQGLAR
jgi:hypothetical protein